MYFSYKEAFEDSGSVNSAVGSDLYAKPGLWDGLSLHSVGLFWRRTRYNRKWVFELLYSLSFLSQSTVFSIFKMAASTVTRRRDDASWRDETTSWKDDDETDKLRRGDDKLTRRDERTTRRDEDSTRRDDKSTRRNDKSMRRGDKLTRRNDKSTRRDDKLKWRHDEVNILSMVWRHI